MRRGVFDIKRVLIAGAAMAVLGAAALASSIAVTANDAAVDAGPMRERVIEVKNHGVPADVVERRDRVLAEIAKGSPDPWAGEYHEGDGEGENTTLYLAPESGVAATWFGCLGLYGSNEGEVDTVDPKTLAFRFRRPNKAHAFGSFPESVRKVHWGERRYLLDPDHFVDFVNAIHRGMEPDWQGMGRMFLLAHGDRDKPVSGLPDLPAEWLAQIRTKPLIVSVSSVEQLPQRGSAEFPTCPLRLTFDVPAGETVVPGLAFHPQDDKMSESVDVVAVDRAQATAEIEVYEACADLKYRPKVGDTLSTGGYLPKEPVASR